MNGSRVVATTLCLLAFAGSAQAFPQEPQRAGSLSKSVSQPFAELPSQLSQPATQAKPQVPLAQVVVACAGA